MAVALHVFQAPTRFHKPTWCGFCGGFVKNPFGKQGYRCSVCKLKIHSACLDAAKQVACPGIPESVGSPKQQKPKIALEAGVKVVILGGQATGKTSLVSRFIKNEFKEHVENTIGAAFHAHKIVVDGREVKLMLWDTAGQEQYRSLAPVFCKDALAALLVYDITNKHSFDELLAWLTDLKTKSHPSISLIIVGNKMDLETSRVVTPAMADEFIRQVHMDKGGDRPSFVECSAKTGQNVAFLFNTLGQRLIAMEAAGKLS